MEHESDMMRVDQEPIVAGSQVMARSYVAARSRLQHQHQQQSPAMPSPMQSLQHQSRRRPRVRPRPPRPATERHSVPLVRHAVALALAIARLSSLRLAAAAPPACSPAPAVLTVRNAADLAELVQRTNCSDGEFTVSWTGRVTFEEPIVVGNSTLVSISGAAGGGAVLDGGGLTRLVEAAGGASLLLKNLELTNGTAHIGGGGAISADGQDFTLQATSCNFTGNQSPVDGGAIISTGGGASIDFIGCRFQGNAAIIAGGAIRANSALAVTAIDTVFQDNTVAGDAYTGGRGGALYLSGGKPQLEFHGCDLRSNNASESGGAVYLSNGGRVVVNQTTVALNWAGFGGGGISAGEGITQVDVLDSVFTQNHVSDITGQSSGFSMYDGGGLAIYGEAQLGVRSSEFSGNSAENGGAMVLRGNHSVSITDSVFDGNVAKHFGGGIALTEYGNGKFEASLTNNTFTGNWCGGSGGAIFTAASSAGNLTLSQTSFFNNSVVHRATVPGGSESHRGGAYYSSGVGVYTVAEACVFEANEARAVGGAVSMDGGILSATNCSFLDNLAGSGGAIAASEDNGNPALIYVREGSMRRNIAEGSVGSGDYGYGGALRAELRAEANLFDVQVEGNAAVYGGGVSISAGSRASCSSVNFSSNAAEAAGGAVQLWGNGSHFSSEGCLFLGNAAEGVAGSGSSGIGSGSGSNDASVPTVDSAGAAGGAISATDGGTVFLTDSMLSGNAADGRGGGVFCGNGSNVTASHVELDGHRSGTVDSEEGHGGAFAAVERCWVNLMDATFVGNHALGPSGGAISAEGGSDVTAIRCTFADNEASGGGAVYGAGRATRVSIESCVLEQNRATKEGGALRAYSLGFLFTESSSFDGNYAGELGGGVHCFECTMSANNCTYLGNSANGDGGAMRLSYDSTVTINRCRFTSNEAVYDGGAIAIDTAMARASSSKQLSTDSSLAQNQTEDSSAVEVECFNSSFTGNTAGERGGSLFSTTDSMVELRDCNSSSNSASLGGSIFMSRSDFVLAKCQFSGDLVSTGAIIYAVGANVRAREVVFIDSTMSSGMLAVHAGSDTLFQAQNCSFSGWVGSDVVLADKTGKLRLDSCDFSGSSATSMVSVDDGGDLAIVRNARLSTANYRAVNYGADVVSTGGNISLFGANIAGCDASECNDGCVDGDLGVYCACYESILDFTDTCLEMLGTIAVEGPESVVSTKYPDDPQSTLEISCEETGNVGPVLWTLDWTDDPNSVAWVAVPSTGLMDPGDTITVSLEGQVASFWNGQSSTIITAEAPYQTGVEPIVVAVNATFIYCTEGEYWDGRAGVEECKLCSDVGLNPDGVECYEQGTLLETLPLARGFWRSIPTTTIIRECYNDNACKGSSSSNRVVTVNDYCAQGYMGPYCAVCMDSYTVGVSHTCHSCDSSFRAGMVVIMALTGVIFLVGIVIVINDLVGNPALTDLSETPFSVLSRRLRTIPFHKLKIPLVVFQIMTQYASITSVEFPPVFQTFLSAISVINLDVGWLFTATCMINVDFHGRLMAATIGPLVVLLVLFGTYIYTCKKHGLRATREVVDHAMYPVPGYRASDGSSDNETEHSVMRRVQDKHTTVALTMAFLLYSTVSTVIFQTFTCDHLEDVDERFLRADYSINCDSTTHKGFKLYAMAMILVYPLGIPTVFAVLLHRKRRLINPPRELRPDALAWWGDHTRSSREPDPRLQDRRIAQTAVLWRAYRPEAYYFEVLECLRRLLLTGCLVFILPDSAGQSAVACVLAVLTVGVFALVHPYSDPNDHRAYTLGALAVFLTMFMGLVVRVDLADEETESQRVLGALLIVLTVSLFVVAVAECLWEARRLSEGARDDDDDAHVFLRRREGKGKDGAMGDDKFKTGGALYAPKLLDVPMNRGFNAGKGNSSNNNSNTAEALENEKIFAAGGGGGRQRGSQMFAMSASADPDHNPRVAIAGTSSNNHPSDRGTLNPTTFPTYRGSGSLGIIAGEALQPRGSSSESHSPLHSRRTGSGGGESYHVRGDSGSGGLVPAEAESAPVGMEMDSALPTGAGDRQGSSRSRRSSGSKREGSRSSRRRRSRDSGGMRPAMPAGPTDEMRPSPDPSDLHPPSPWMS